MYVTCFLRTHSIHASANARSTERLIERKYRLKESTDVITDVQILYRSKERLKESTDVMMLLILVFRKISIIPLDQRGHTVLLSLGLISTDKHNHKPIPSSLHTF